MTRALSLIATYQNGCLVPEERHRDTFARLDEGTQVHIIVSRSIGAMEAEILRATFGQHFGEVEVREVRK